MRCERGSKDALKVAQKQGTKATLMQEKKLLKLMRTKEDGIRAQRFESAFFWDRQGSLILSRDGELTRVKFTDEERVLLQGSFSTHNHPLGWNYSERDPRRAGNSFSENDVRAACYFSLAILRIVTPQLRYMMKPPPEGWDGDYWEKILRPTYCRIYQQTWDEFMAKVKARQMLSSVAGTTFLQEVWSRVAAQLGLKYSREEF